MVAYQAVWVGGGTDLTGQPPCRLNVVQSVRLHVQQKDINTLCRHVWQLYHTQYFFFFSSLGG